MMFLRYQIQSESRKREIHVFSFLHRDDDKDIKDDKYYCLNICYFNPFLMSFLYDPLLPIFPNPTPNPT